MELRHLRYFVAVAEELHFGRAARRLHISQPPLSMTIRALEDEIGVQLLARSRTRVELTEAGRVFLRESRLTLEQAHRATRIAQCVREGLHGSFRLGYSPSVDLKILPALLRDLLDTEPGLEMCPHSMTATEQIGALRDRAIDAGFLRMPLERGDDDGLTVRPVYEEPLVLAIAASHPLAKLPKIPLKKLADERVIIFARNVAPHAYDDIIARSREAGFALRIAYEPDALQTGISLAAAGLGIAFVPESAEVISRESLVFRRMSAPEITLRMGFAHRRDDEGAMLRVVNAAVDRLNPQKGPQKRAKLSSRASARG